MNLKNFFKIKTKIKHVGPKTLFKSKFFQIFVFKKSNNIK